MDRRKSPAKYSSNSLGNMLGWSDTERTRIALAAPRILISTSNNAGTTSVKPLSLRAILLFAVLVRLTVAISALKVSGDFSIFHDPDTAGYLAPAKALLAGEFATSGAPEITRTPGYPLLLAVGVG